MTYDADAIVVGAGLAGLVATAELADAGRRVILLDQEPQQSCGGQAFWSFGGLFLVNSPEQRRLRIRDSYELALQDWLGTAGFDGPADHWPRRWAEAYVAFAAGEKRAWLHAQGVRFCPIVGWAERGGYGAIGHGNSVPRFHVVWGTGPGVMSPFARRVHEAAGRGLVTLKFRHRVDDLICTNGAVEGVHGQLLEPSAAQRGTPSSRVPVGSFTLHAPAVIVTSGGDHPGGRWHGHQSRPHVALHRGHPQLEPYLGEPRHSHPAWSVLDVVRRTWQPPAGAAVSGLRYARYAGPPAHGPFTKDLQITAIRGARNYLGDRLIRTAKPHKLLDPAAGPLIAVRLHIVTRKTLGGLQTDMSARVLRADGQPLPGLYAAGEVAGFGGGGMHGHRALEGTFLGGCLFSGRIAGRAAAGAVR